MIKKCLIANRGEIALRVIRACQELDIATVAVYSDVDRCDLHVRYADEAICLKGSQAKDSYLNFEKIFEAAADSGADAIHPGYGFLSENAEFAKAVVDKGLTWVGPPAKVIADMGDKIKARAMMAKAGVPVIPGSKGALSDPQEIEKVAQDIGFPLMIKAAAGGGGKGIRRVDKSEDLMPAFRLCSQEAESNFAEASVYLEKMISPARHIEVQIFADNFGKVVHMGERECSLQRRSQKLIEESPSPFVSESLREKMTEISVKAAQSIHYQGAGTFEFLVDEQENFYFLEMNTRLQVEHTVTEQVTGLDLVKEQLLVAGNQQLSFTQDSIKARGHSMELRICCENVFKNFSPSVGKVQDLHMPGGPHVRLDSALYLGLEVTLHYDPMLAKLVVWAADRKKAIKRMRHAVKEFHLLGVKTTLPLFLLLAEDKRFLEGDFHTQYLEEFMAKQKQESSSREKAAALCAVVLEHLKNKSSKTSLKKKDLGESWRQAGFNESLRGWRR